jgi:transcription antitermination factor NusG
MVKKKESSEFFWICLDIRERYCKAEYYSVIKDNIVKVLGSDLKEYLFVGLELSQDVQDNLLTSYIFVHCRNIHDHIDNIKTIKFIRTILNDYTKIRIISDEEIEDLKRDWYKKIENKQNFVYGDVVKVKSGVFSSLHGIVIGKETGKYKLLFKFNLGCVVETFLKDNLFFHSNIFNFMKIPLEM